MTHLMSRGHRAAAVLAAAALLPLLAACSGEAEDPAASDATATGSAATTSSARPTAGPDIEATGDPFCDLAVENLAVSEELELTASEIETILVGVAADTGDISALNQWGSELGALAQETVTFYDEAAPYVVGTDAADDFATMRVFVNDYSVRMAGIAAAAPDNATFLAQMQEFSLEPATLEVVNSGTAAAQVVYDYIVDRCDVVG